MPSNKSEKKGKIIFLEKALEEKGFESKAIKAIYDSSKAPLQTLRKIYQEINSDKDYSRNYNDLEAQLLKKGFDEKALNAIIESEDENYMNVLRKIYKSFYMK